VVVDKGTIMAEGTPAELIRRYSSREVLEVRFGSDRNAQVAEQLSLRQAQGTVGQAQGTVGQAQGAADQAPRNGADRMEVLPDRILVYSDNGEAELVRIIEAGFHPITSLVRRSSLEDVFLRLTGRSLIE
jgi:lipooligosaccharide transport system ATP-binding protein